MNSTPTRVGHQDPALTARVTRRIPLHYTAGADPALDRPPHVRAGSGIAWVGERLAVVQDDASFVVLVHPGTLHVDAVTLPPGADGLRQFDDLRGNKAFKLDLEACVSVGGRDGVLLAAFGSGSAPPRETVVTVAFAGDAAPRVTVYPAPALYATLRAATHFSRSEMNLEGAVLVDGRLRLFGRGNGAPRNGLLPVDAVCELPWDAVLAHLRAPDTVPPPPPERVVRYELGEMDGLRLTFTDAAPGPGGALLFTAAAEDSPDATRDGRVAGSAVGIIAADGTTRWAPLLAEDGGLFDGKTEGVELAADSPRHLWTVVDRDDPHAPSELCRVELDGAWW